jgi:hypothetical protein
MRDPVTIRGPSASVGYRCVVHSTTPQSVAEINLVIEAEQHR